MSRRLFIVTTWVFISSAVSQTDKTGSITAPPILLGAALPNYPPIWRAARIAGGVTVQITIRDGVVASEQVLRGDEHLRIPTLANVKTWRFSVETSRTLVVTYSYKIAGEPTDYPTNPLVRILPSLDVEIIARPVKPTVNF